MAAKKDQHAFDINLAIEVGIEKAILLGGIHYWISENEKRKSDLHFRLGEYWTYDTADGFALKYPYLKAKSIYRWMNELERDGWVKTEQFRLKGVLDQTRWYGRGQRYLKWLNPAISQNEKSEGETGVPISHFDPAISQNENPISHFDPSDSQNEKSLYKDTVVNSVQTAVDKLHSLSNAGEGDVLEVETEEVFRQTVSDEADPQTPGCAAPLSPVDQPVGLTDADRLELAEHTHRLQTNYRIIEGLSRQQQLRGDDALHWIEQFATTQWIASNLIGRPNKDLILHCLAWIGQQLQNQRERQQRQSIAGRRYRNGTGGDQNRTDSGEDIDRLADQLFNS